MKEPTNQDQGRNLLGMVRRLLLAEVAFQEIFQKYKKGKLRFSDIENWIDDKGKSLLYNLKEQSHNVFRAGSNAPFHRDEWLLDLVIGSIFHEAMKLRENIYQVEVYGPRYLQFKSKTRKISQVYERDYVQKFEQIISRAKQGVAEGMEETRSFFKDATEQLFDFFRKNSQNPFLVRMLLEHLPLLRRVYGSRRAKEIFAVMFKKGLLDAYSLAGRSHLESGHYDLSSLYFSKALRRNPSDPELRFFLNFSLGMKAYYRNAYSKALSYFRKLGRLRWNRRSNRHYLRKAEEVCHKISSELKEDRKVKASARCQHLADQIRKML